MIYGQTIFLKPAYLSDRRKVFHWLTRSDVTSSMMGPPLYPDAPIPTWEQFCADYPDSFFGPWNRQPGKLFMILREGEEIGTVGFDLLNKQMDHVLLDIWLKAKKFCGHGYGTSALNSVCAFLHKQCGITRFFICPSARNKRACAAYLKCGFEIITMTGREMTDEFGPMNILDYSDNVIMKKVILIEKAYATEEEKGYD